MKKVKSPGYSRRVEFRSPSAKVFPALTTRRGLQGWWTRQVEGDGQIGSDWHLHLGADRLDLRVGESLAPAVDQPGLVEWLCLARTDLPEWVETTIRFELLETAGNRCQIRFTHVGLQPGLPCYSDSTLAWDLNLQSLVDFVDQGKGEPLDGSSG